MMRDVLKHRSNTHMRMHISHGLRKQLQRMKSVGYRLPRRHALPSWELQLYGHQVITTFNFKGAALYHDQKLLVLTEYGPCGLDVVSG